MRFVIGTNKIISSLIKDSISRKIIFNSNFKLVTPDYSFTEIYKYEEEIRGKANIS